MFVTTRDCYGDAPWTAFAHSSMSVRTGWFSTGSGGRSLWICAVVGLHFFPLAVVLHAPSTRWLGVAVTSVAAAGLLTGLFSNVAPSTVTCTGGGVALLSYSVLILMAPIRTRQ